MKQNNIFKTTLKFSEKTSVSNVNVSVANALSKPVPIIGFVKCASLD